MNSYEGWEPLSPMQVAEQLASMEAPWWIAGGWAIDLFVGNQTRPHADIDVLVLRRDQNAVQQALAGWDLHAADPPGTLRPWVPGEQLREGIHDIWCRPTPTTAWTIQVMLAEDDVDDWLFRRNRHIRGPIADMGLLSPEGLPFLAPEIQLLYKASATPRPKDEQDFATVLPFLSPERKTWLRNALAIHAPTHPWRELLV